MSQDVAAQRLWIERVLAFRFPDDGSDPAAAGRPDGAAVRLAHGLLIWNQARSHVSGEIKKLQAAVLDQCRDEPDFAEVKANIGNLDVVLERLDDRLLDKLGELRSTSDAAAKGRLSAEARKIVADYQAYVSTDELMNEIDDNGFVPLDVTAHVTAALQEVLATI